MTISAAPLTPENEGRDAVLHPQECDDCDKTKQFVVHMNRSFILDTTNGDIIHSGIIVAEIKDGGQFAGFISNKTVFQMCIL